MKGYSVLHLLRNFDVINGNPVYYMHCVLLGVTKKLLNLWLSSEHHSSDWLVLYMYMIIYVPDSVVMTTIMHSDSIHLEKVYWS